MTAGGARHLLVEMFHPGDLPITDQKIVVRRNPDFDRMIRGLGVTVNYRRALADGTSARKAAKAAGKQAGVTERQAFRWIQEESAR
jgi:hypothetical protein